MGHDGGYDGYSVHVDMGYFDIIGCDGWLGYRWLYGYFEVFFLLRNGSCISLEGFYFLEDGVGVGGLDVYEDYASEAEYNGVAFYTACFFWGVLEYDAILAHVAIGGW